MKCLNINYDERLKCYVATVVTTYEWYLSATKNSEENLLIQRDIIRDKKTYQTLREDLKRGCVLPPLVLAARLENISPVFAEEPGVNDINSETILSQLEIKLDSLLPADIQIIDGLQRTNALRTVLQEMQGAQLAAFLQRPIRLEFWLNIPFYALAYRMLLLNAGQKPMSMKHQIEILSESMRLDLKDIADLDILRGMDNRRRVKPGQFQLSALAGTFQAWIQKQPNIDIRNAVTEQLLADEAVTSLGKQLTPSSSPMGRDFKEFVAWLVKLDNALGQDDIAFLGNETVLHALAASISSSYSNPELRDRCDKALDRLLLELEKEGASILGVDLFSDLRTQIDPKRKNVGEATRDFVYRAMSEYIISSGTKNMRDCWTFAGSYL